MKKFVVRVPATSANLGPGYDCMGLALSMYSEFTFEEAESFSVTGCPEEFQNEDNLVLVAYRKAFGAAGKEPRPVKLSIAADEDMPAPSGTSPAKAMLKPFTSTPRFFISCMMP